MKRTRKQVEGDSESRVYDKVAPWGLLSCLLTFVSLCHRYCGCKQVSAMCVCAYVGVRTLGLSTSRDWCLGCMSPDPTGSLRARSLHGPGVPADRCSWTRQLGLGLGGISCLWVQPLSRPGKVCQSSLHTYKTLEQ